MTASRTGSARLNGRPSLPGRTYPSSGISHISWAGYCCGTSNCLQMSLHRLSRISAWRGTSSYLPVAGFA